MNQFIAVLCLALFVESSQYCSDHLVSAVQCDTIRRLANDTAYNDADSIIDGIYLGNVCAAHNITWLLETDISFVFNVASEWNGFACHDRIRLFHFPFDDSTDLDIKTTRRLINRVTDHRSQRVSYTRSL